MNYDENGRPSPIIVWTPLEARSAMIEKLLDEFLDRENNQETESDSN